MGIGWQSCSVRLNPVWKRARNSVVPVSLVPPSLVVSITARVCLTCAILVVKREAFYASVYMNTSRASNGYSGIDTTTIVATRFLDRHFHVACVMRQLPACDSANSHKRFQHYYTINVTCRFFLQHFMRWYNWSRFRDNVSVCTSEQRLNSPKPPTTIVNEDYMYADICGAKIREHTPSVLT